MGVIDKVSALFEYPPLQVYHCRNCGGQFDEATDSCPECGGEVTVTEHTYNMYQGPL